MDRAVISFDGWKFARDSGELERAGKRVRLQELSRQILVELASRPGELVTRDQLVTKLWPQGVVEYELGLNTAMSKLRAALEDSADQPRYIETLPRKGYRFIAHIDEPMPSQSEPSVVEPDTPQNEPVAASPGWPRRFLGLFAVALLVVIGLGSWMIYASRAPAPRPRLAVLPFENLSPDPANAFFADGMHEEILSTLANRATDLDVISRTTMMTYRSRPRSVPEIAKELNVTHVLEGSARRDGQSVRITVQLIDAREDRHLWSQNFDGDPTTSMELQSKIAQQIADQLSVKLAHTSDVLPMTQNAESYDYYLRGKLGTQAINQRTSLAEAARIEGWFTRAIELDRSFGAAWLGRANIGAAKYVQNLDVSAENLEAALTDIAEARRLLGDAPAVIRIESRLNVFTADGAARFRRLEEPQVVASRDPATILWRAFTHCRSDQCERGLPLYAEAAALDPGNRTIFFAWSLDLWALRRPADALRVVQSYNEHGPGRMPFGDLEFAFTGRAERLRRDLDELTESMGDESRLLSTFDLLRFEGRFKEMNALLAAYPADRVRQGGFREYGTPGIGYKPIAALKGWAALLNGDRAGASAAAPSVLDFAKTPTFSRNGTWHARMLAAEGALFAGNRTQAIEDAHAAVALQNAGFGRRFAGFLGARVLAWAGAHDDAVALLEEISSKFPALGPAEITRDPLFSIPLKDHARYRALAAKLESEIAANQVIFGR